MMLGPRLVLAGAWLLSDWYRAFDSTIIAVLGWLFAPWTSLAWMYIALHHGGKLEGGYAVLLAVGVIVDLSSLGGSHQARRMERASTSR
jgi:hypothetical protein